MPVTLWPLGGLWLTIDVVETLRFQYSTETHRTLFPILEGCIEFLLDFLITSGDYLVTSPSLSPENTFLSKSGQKGIFCEGSVLDISIVRLAFDQFLWSLERLGLKEHHLAEQVTEAQKKLPHIVVSGEGLIQEWGLEDFDEVEPGHRHVSHLFGLYPANLISPVTSPHLAEAARKVLQKQAQHGGGHTGWSRAWLMNLHARLFDGKTSGQHMDLLLGASTLPNLLDTHPPFQINGNFDGCAGILECLVQSLEISSEEHVDKKVVEIRLLPSCPKTWQSGDLTGARTRGGWEVSFRWQDGIIVGPVEIYNTQVQALPAVIVYPDGARVAVRPSELCNSGRIRTSPR